MFSELTSQDILSAIQKILKEEPLRDTPYAVWYNGTLISPSRIISVAYELRGESLSRRSFTTDHAQKRLLELGFPIVDRKTEDNFFGRKELESFATLVKRRQYNASNPVDQNMGKFLNRLPWSKTKKWAKLLEQRDYIMEGRISWTELDKGVGQHFKKYTWYRLLPYGHRNKLLFFTVGIHEDGSLVYKMDIQKNDKFFTNHINKHKNYFYTVAKEEGARWNSIKPTEVQNLNWDSLVELTLDFMDKQMGLYWEFTSEWWPEERMMRLTWNENNWEYPSGHPWKKKNQANSNIAFEKQYGFGYEEWLFNLRYRKDGVQYGYIRGAEGISRSEYFLEKVVLFTIRSNDKKRFIIGELKDVEIIEGNEEEQEAIAPLFDAFRNEVIEELQAVNADWQYFSRATLRPNVKFKWEEASIYPDILPADALDDKRFHRFNPYRIEGDLQTILRQEVEKDLKMRFKKGKASASESYSKETTARKSRVKRSHTRITDDLYDYLHQVEGYPEDKLSAELTRVGNSIVDFVIEEEENRFSLFEAKTYSLGLRNIRAAIGQLLEYSLMDRDLELHRLIIVGPATLKKEEKDYFERLKAVLKPNLYYWAYQPAETALEHKFKPQ